ncbi:hypothetical protein OPV22_011853 [Ensete ventricosum]|uniref:Polyadenylate-binding protein n=1 Tax=Ensete ventricosum TaxID=4639 RepID=A0AAV8REE3_ENSVE|nr:hypothetical protein OPV22_011853 [Ensete ventricosum]
MAPVQLRPQATVAPGSAGGSPSSSTSLYVGELDLRVTDAQLYDIFSQIGQVVSARVCRDVYTCRSLGYGYVNFTDAADAARALEVRNFMLPNGKIIHAMSSNSAPIMRKSGTGSIFIKNLDKSINNRLLHDTFSVFGNIISCKVAIDASRVSKGYGFVMFEQEEAAQNAIENVNGMILNDKKIFVGPLLSKQERENAGSNTKFNNVFVKNLSKSVTEDSLEEVFGEFGKISSCIVMREEDGKSKCFGFVNFENPDDAAQAVQVLNGKKFDAKEWYVGKAQRKWEREKELKNRFAGSKEATEKSNLYLKNLDDSIGDDNLRELFSGFGTIASCKVMRDEDGVSKGCGFVAFQSPEDASRALSEMNGKMMGRKPLYVAPAQRKKDRRDRLQALFSEMPPSNAPYIPQDPAGAPPQSLVPGMSRHGTAAPSANFCMPMAGEGGQQAQGFGARGAGGGPVQRQQLLPMPGVQQMIPRRRGGGSMLPSIPLGVMTSTLVANSIPDKQRTMLGEKLYPLVDQLEHGHAAQVTGMLLEMDQTQVLHLLESPEDLKAKVAEAVGVLRGVTQFATAPAP